MATAVRMPQLGVTMTEAKLLRWLKAVGEPVEAGEPLAEIETDKLSTEVAATTGGVLRTIVAAEGTVVPVTGLLAVIGRADEPASAIDALVAGRGDGEMRGDGDEEMRRAVAGPLISSSTVSLRSPAPPTSPSVRATPLAKRLAAEHGLDLAAIGGSGPGGRITEADVRASTAATAPDAGGFAHTNVATADGGFVRASPLARRLARERGLDLQAIAGSGPEGRVLERDVLTATTAKATVTEPRRVETIKVDGMRRLIGERLLRSVQTSAQLTLTTEADATGLVELRGHLLPAARVYGHRPPTYTDLLVHLVSRVLPAHPLLNSSLLEEGESQEIACWADVNIGVAVALERGLVVPVVRHADQKALDAISAELGHLVECARAGRLSMDDLQGGTFTITNLGAQEVDAFTPIINPPQCAILGVGRIVKKPAVVEDQIVVRQLLTLSLTFDHRIVDGAPAAIFLRDVKRAIERVLDETGGQDRRG
jgi:pyruvate dehydrogenase E2 component (dihydrolipoamide acetyltransferase)